MERNTFVFYKDWMDAIKGLPDDVRLDIYEGVIEYATTGNVRGLKSMASVAFNFIKTTIDRDTEKYVSIAEKNRVNGSKGGRPKTGNNPKNPVGYLGSDGNPKNLNSDSVSDSVNDNDLKDRGKTGKRFTPPSLKDISDFISENNYCVDAETFQNFYQAKGWMVGKNKMKDWRASIRTWNQKEKSSAKKENHATTIPARLRTSDFD